MRTPIIICIKKGKRESQKNGYVCITQARLLNLTTINGTCSVEYGTKNGNIIGYDWDKNEKYYNAMAKYEAQKLFIDSKNKYIIVDDELANSNEFLSNMLIENSFVLLSLEQGMSEENMKPTNIAVETCFQQVSDETD